MSPFLKPLLLGSSSSTQWEKLALLNKIFLKFLTAEILRIKNVLSIMINESQIKIIFTQILIILNFEILNIVKQIIVSKILSVLYLTCNI